MADEIRKVPDEIGENTENKQEGAVPDDEAADAAGGGSALFAPIPHMPPPTSINQRRDIRR